MDWNDIELENGDFNMSFDVALTTNHNNRNSANKPKKQKKKFMVFDHSHFTQSI